jgi:hypothetical protein
MAAKNKFLNTNFSAYYFWKLHLHYFSKIKRKKELLNSMNQGFSYDFCMIIEGSGSRAGSGSIPLTSGSGSGSGRDKIRGSSGSGSGCGSGSATLVKTEYGKCKYINLKMLS